MYYIYTYMYVVWFAKADSSEKMKLTLESPKHVGQYRVHQVRNKETAKTTQNKSPKKKETSDLEKEEKTV